MSEREKIESKRVRLETEADRVRVLAEAALVKADGEKLKPSACAFRWTINAERLRLRRPPPSGFVSTPK